MRQHACRVGKTDSHKGQTGSSICPLSATIAGNHKKTNPSGLVEGSLGLWDAALNMPLGVDIHDHDDLDGSHPVGLTSPRMRVAIHTLQVITV